MREAALTTTDNPYDPFTQFDDWYAFDEQKGYHSCSYLQRVAYIGESLGYQSQMDDTERAIDEIVNYNLLGIYKKVVRETPDTPEDALSSDK